VCRLSALLLLPLLGLLLAPAQAADAGRTRQQIQQLQADIKAFRAEIRSTSSEQQRQQQQLEQLEVDAGRVDQQLDRLAVQRGELSTDIEALGQRRQELQRSRQQQSAALGEQLALAYRSGQQDKLKLLLNQEQPERVARMLRYHHYFSEARVAAIGQFNQTLDELQAVEQSLTAKQAELAEQQRDLSQQRQKLQQLRASREQLLASLTQEIAGQNRQLAQLEADRARMEKVLQELQRALAKADLAITTQRFSRLKGRLNWPTQGKVVQAYGSRTHGVQSDGMLIGANAGQAVSAVHNGRVVYSDWLRGYGLVLIIDHGDGYMSLYGHNQSLLKEVGDWVAAGERVAKVGDTGGQARSGLYFAIRHNGKPQNPQPWLNRKRG